MEKSMIDEEKIEDIDPEVEEAVEEPQAELASGEVEFEEDPEPVGNSDEIEINEEVTQGKAFHGSFGFCLPKERLGNFNRCFHIPPVFIYYHIYILEHFLLQNLLPLIRSSGRYLQLQGW